MSISDLRKSSTTAAKSILSNGVDTLTTLSASVTAATPHANVTSAESAFVAAISTDVTAANDTVDGLYKIVRDALTMGIENIRALEKFIGLRVPQMGEFVAMTINSLFFVCILMRLLFESYANTNSLSI
jgi:hypothetical protein